MLFGSTFMCGYVKIDKRRSVVTLSNYLDSVLLIYALFKDNNCTDLTQLEIETESRKYVLLSLKSVHGFS